MGMRKGILFLLIFCGLGLCSAQAQIKLSGKTGGSRSVKVRSVPVSKRSVPSSHVPPKTSIPLPVVNKPVLLGRPETPLSRGRQRINSSRSRLGQTSNSLLGTVTGNSLQGLQMQSFPLKRTFRAHSSALEPDRNFFSGTFFKTQYQGKEEVYGVVAAHTLIDGASDEVLQRHFMAQVYMDGSFVEVPMEIVQLSAPGMLDVALIKIPEEIIPLLEPYTLGSPAMAGNEPFVSFGFVGNDLKQVENRYLINGRSVYSMRTMMPIALGTYVGGCGGPVEYTDAAGNTLLIGIHTGSSGSIAVDGGNVGYATNAQFLNTLVNAYHQDAQAHFPLEIGGKHVMDLQADEYISAITFLDRKGGELATHQFVGKFSYTAVNRILEEYPVRTLELTVARIGWEEDNPEVVKPYTYVRRVAYDFQTEELVEIED